MKKTPLLLAAALLSLGLLASPRGAVSGIFDTTVKGDLLTADVKETTPPPEPSIFDTLVTITGRVTSMSSAAVGGYTCQTGVIKLDPRARLVRFIRGPTLEEEDSDAETPSGGPAKVVVSGKTIVIPGFGGDFRGVLAILHAAKLTGKEVSIQAAAFPNCPVNQNAFIAADVTIN